MRLLIAGGAGYEWLRGGNERMGEGCSQHQARGAGERGQHKRMRDSTKDLHLRKKRVQGRAVAATHCSVFGTEPAGMAYGSGLEDGRHACSSFARGG